MSSKSRKCPECGVKFATKKELLNHFGSHTNGQLFGAFFPPPTSVESGAKK